MAKASTCAVSADCNLFAGHDGACRVKEVSSVGSAVGASRGGVWRAAGNSGVTAAAARTTGTPGNSGVTASAARTTGTQETVAAARQRFGLTRADSNHVLPDAASPMRRAIGYVPFVLLPAGLIAGRLVARRIAIPLYGFTLAGFGGVSVFMFMSDSFDYPD